MSTWTGVSQLSVKLTTGAPSCKIYANGQNRVGVTISVTPTDENGDRIQVDPQHLASNLWLIDYLDESTLSWNGKSGWAYTDTMNEFTAVPDGAGEHAEVATDDNGTHHVTFYVYCSPDVDQKSIAVRVRTDPDDDGCVNTITSSQDGRFDSSVVLRPRTALTFTRDDINWDYSRASTQESGNTKYVTTDAWNYYLSLKDEENYFVTFRVHGHCSDSGYDGLIASHIPPDDHRRNFYGGYVWYSEPHAYGTGEIVNFPAGNNWWDYTTVYDKSYPDQYLCFTWVHSTTGGDGWHIPNGPVTNWHVYYTPRVVVWDRYGNTGTFWVDGSDITGGLNIYDYHP
ncbi:hypothetical protein [Kitasatospora sp. NPDC090091]|uniref:hypothetical protein n=1 Tax=Kitasatospora sp. NPDC090091 TaxID=3364081 RepID=UPI0038001DB8